MFAPFLGMFVFGIVLVLVHFQLPARRKLLVEWEGWKVFPVCPSTADGWTHTCVDALLIEGYSGGMHQGMNVTSVEIRGKHQPLWVLANPEEFKAGKMVCQRSCGH